MRLGELFEGLVHGDLSTSALSDARERGLSTKTFLALIGALGALHGACVGLYGLWWGKAYGLAHLVAVMCKVPLLFLLTLLVTLPSLYVFAALGGSRLRLGPTLRLFLAATTLALVVLSSLGPVIVFFTFSTRSHPFLQVLNAAAATLAGLVALRFLRRRLEQLAPGEEFELADGVRVTRHSRAGLVFTGWLVVYALVGAQMAWILRPFVGTPHMPQELFRNTQSNIFEGLLQALKYL